MTGTEHGELSPSCASGVVVLAAYRPDPALFAAQLRSIRDQTLTDFVCLVGADGCVDQVRAQVERTVPDDDRFHVVGWSERVGFYENFERLLREVPPKTAWVALSDQDDVWNKDKLERLVPLLAHVPLVTGQARIVAPNGNVMNPRTQRHVAAPESLLLENQVSGALCVFRGGLLELALPFPRLHTVTQLHDHWLAMCASATGGFAVLDEVVQDYVQHETNVVGEGSRAKRSTRPPALYRLIKALAFEYTGKDGLIDCLEVCRQLSYGWRSAMLDTLASRVPALPPGLARAHRQAHRRRGALTLLFNGLRSPDVSGSVMATFLAGLPGELLLHRRTT